MTITAWLDRDTLVRLSITQPASVDWPHRPKPIVQCIHEALIARGYGKSVLNAWTTVPRTDGWTAAGQ